MIIVDAHQDLAWNIATFGRDYSRSVAETRNIELQSKVPEYNGDTLIGWPEYQKGNVALVFSTLFAAHLKHKLGEWDIQCYSDGKHAYKIYQNQKDIYYEMVDTQPDKFQFIFSQEHLSKVLADWHEDKPSHTVGLVMLMEGADAVNHPEELFEWWHAGVRIIGPAWKGTRFCGGTGEPGPLTKEGYALLEGMAENGFTLDVSHMDEGAALQALDFFSGTIIASHANVAALMPGNESNRHLSDRLLKGLIERDAVIGTVFFNNFLKSGWKQGDPRQDVPLDFVVNHIDTICQIAGNANHVGIGSDFDGGFGVQSAPAGIDSVADLQKVIPLLVKKGYEEKDISKIMGGNWISFLKTILPEDV